ADAGRTVAAAQSAGLLAVSYGLAQRCRNDDELLRLGFAIYDALYQWCRKAPPGPDFALERPDARGPTGWWPAVHAPRSRAHARRVLAALSDATARETGRERALSSRDEPRPRAPAPRVAPLRQRVIVEPLWRE